VNPATPLEACGHARISASSAIAAYLDRLAATSDEADCQTLGYSVRGTPLRALLIRRAGASGRRLRVMLVGSHHGGSEPAGGEALLVIARALLHGDLRDLLAHLEFVIVPDVNPDGRDDDVSRNANHVNLNRDYVLLSQPESRALNAALQRYRPDVVLDAHESAALKRRTLGREGWLTEFQAQFDVANNPALPRAMLAYGEEVLLPDLIARVCASGLHAQRYIREITSTTQALTHGGTTIRRFRNKAGALGALSFLLETRRDPSEASYPSFRNIEVRSAKQILCIRAFLHAMVDRADEVAAMRTAISPPRPGEPLVLGADYVPAGEGAVHHVPLRRIDTGEVVTVPFPDHRRMAPHPPLLAPRAYVCTRHVPVVRDLLLRHGLAFELLTHARTVEVEERIVERVSLDAPPELGPAATTRSLRLPPGALRIPLDQAFGRVVSLLLEPLSASSAFAHPAYRRLLTPGQPLFLFREP
jgi:hypothetical protein